jgi:hypothetical protein
MINTLDLDYTTKEELERIINKIKRNDCCKYIEYKESNSKGFHVTITCLLNNCDVCRLVFDEDKRFAIDSVRPKAFRDYFFDDKTYLGNIPITLENLMKIKEMKI